jgi:molybdate transport system substrate-binding protein
LRIAAASDLQTALPDLADRFTKQTKIEVSLIFGASGHLADQIKQGAPFDVFLAANQKFVHDVATAGCIRSESVHPYARGTLVLAIDIKRGEPIETLADLAKPDVKFVVLANPDTAPYGAAGKQALERAGLWDNVAPKIVRAESVRGALQFVQSGNAEAGFVGSAIARVPEVRSIVVDPKLYDPIVQALGIVSRTDKLTEAEAFTQFVLSETGQGILAGFGFGKAGRAVEPVPAKTQP